MVGRPVLTSPPTSEPISLTLVKQMLRIDESDTSQDTYLSLLISTARETAESHTSRGYITQSYREFYDGFPGHWLHNTLIDGLDGYGGLDGLSRSHDGRRRHHHHFELSRSPLQTIKQIQYLDCTGTIQTLPGPQQTVVPAQYVINSAGDPCDITRASEQLGGMPWPIALRQVNSVWIDYVVGYGGNVTLGIEADTNVITGATFAQYQVGSPLSIPGAGAAGSALTTTLAAVDESGNGTTGTAAIGTVAGANAYLGGPILFGDTQAMLMLISHWDANRLPIQAGIPKEIEYSVKYLLDKERVYYQP